MAKVMHMSRDSIEAWYKSEWAKLSTAIEEQVDSATLPWVRMFTGPDVRIQTLWRSDCPDGAPREWKQDDEWTCLPWSETILNDVPDDPEVRLLHPRR
jgi:hypothetical protein